MEINSEEMGEVQFNDRKRKSDTLESDPGNVGSMLEEPLAKLRSKRFSSSPVDTNTNNCCNRMELKHLKTLTDQSYHHDLDGEQEGEEELESSQETDTEALISHRYEEGMKGFKTAFQAMQQKAHTVFQDLQAQMVRNQAACDELQTKWNGTRKYVHDQTGIAEDLISEEVVKDWQDINSFTRIPKLSYRKNAVQEAEKFQRLVICGLPKWSDITLAGFQFLREMVSMDPESFLRIHFILNKPWIVLTDDPGLHWAFASLREISRELATQSFDKDQLLLALGLLHATEVYQRWSSYLGIEDHHLIKPEDIFTRLTCWLRKGGALEDAHDLLFKVHAVLGQAMQQCETHRYDLQLFSSKCLSPRNSDLPTNYNLEAYPTRNMFALRYGAHVCLVLFDNALNINGDKIDFPFERFSNGKSLSVGLTSNKSPHCGPLCKWLSSAMGRKISMA